MDTAVGLILDAKSDTELENLKKTLEMNLEKLIKTSNHFGNVIKTLDPKKHSLGLVYLCFAKMHDKIDQSFLQGVEILLFNLDQSQVSKCSFRFVQVIHEYTQVLLKNGMAIRGVKTLAEGIKRFRPNQDCLTGIHSDFLACCLKTINLKAALPILEQIIFDVQPEKTGTSPKEMLLYFYYGGMIYLGLKKYEKASSFFETSLLVPSFALNAIMVESFKKYILTSLLLNGKYTGLPKNSSNIVHRQIKFYAQGYLEFATAFDKRELDKCTSNSVQYSEIYKKDNNFGLIKQCITALSRNSIQKLTETYLTLSLNDIAKTAKLQSSEEAEKLLLSMIENGEIKGVISQKDKKVSFNEEIREFNSTETNSILDKKINQSIELCYKLKRMDQEIGKSVTYIARLHGIRDDMIEVSQRKGLGKLLDMFR